MSTVSHCEHRILKLIKLIEALSPHSLTDNFLRKPLQQRMHSTRERGRKRRRISLITTLDRTKTSFYTVSNILSLNLERDKKYNIESL